MGCHTWLSVPYIKGKEEIIEVAKQYLTSDHSKYISEGHKRMYQWAIDNEIIEPILEIASIQIDGSDRDNSKWVLYKGIEEYSVEEYNKKNGTNIGRHDFKYWNEHPDALELYSDEPRIGGYPDTIVRSYQEMLDFIKVGFTDEEGKHFDFYYSEERYPEFMKGIEQFFINHPEGIITFG